MMAHRQRQRGSMTLVVLCLTTVLGAAVISYVALCARTMELSNRSYCYTSCTRLAEIGLEESLWSLNQALQASNNNSTYTWPGWTLATISGVPTASLQLTGFTINKGISATVNVQITNYNPQTYVATDPTTYPVITADGVAQLPDGIAIDRRLQVRARPAAVFNVAVGATGSVNSNHYVWFSTGGTVDSYDATQGAYTPSPSTTNRSDQAIIAGPYVWVYGATVLGYAASCNTFLGAPYLDTNSSLKSLTSPSSPAVDPSRMSNNASQNIFDISFPNPQPAGSTVTDGNQLLSLSPLGTAGSTTPTYYYVTGDVTLNGGMTLTVAGPVVIKIDGNLTLQNNAQIIVSNNGTPSNYTDDGSLQIIVGGNFNIGGNGINNQTKRPSNLAILGTTGSSGVTQYLNSTTTDFIGVIYVPQGVLEIDNAVNVYGALAAQYVRLLGAPAIHYDVSLSKASFSLINTPYDIYQWLSN